MDFPKINQRKSLISIVLRAYYFKKSRKEVEKEVDVFIKNGEKDID